jgi:hypothetical protein
MARKDDDLAPDPNAPGAGEEGARAIVGILGESDDKDAVRLHLDLEFTRSYEIPREAIVGRERVPAARSPLGVDASVVRVRPGTVLRLRTSHVRSVEDEFLAGDFTAAGSYRPAGPEQAVAFDRRFGGLTVQGACETVDTPCVPTLGPRCHSFVDVCLTERCPTLWFDTCGGASVCDVCPPEGDPFSF